MSETKRPAVTPRKPAPRHSASATIDLRQPFIVLRSHLAIAAVIALVACSFLAWHQLRQPKIFSATAVLVIERSERMDPNERWDSGMGDVAAMTRIEQLRSPELAQRVSASFSAEEGVVITGQAAGGAGLERQIKRILRSSISFSRREGTMLLAITADHEDPRAAALLANRYAEQAMRYAVDRASATTDASLAFLREQADDLRKKSEAAERDLQEYRQRFNLVSLEDNQNIVVDNLKALNTSATAARVTRMATEAQLAQAEKVMADGEDAAQLASLTGAENLADVARRLSDLRSKRSVMAERYGRRHPAMQENERAIEALAKVRDDELRTTMAALRDQRDKARAEERQLEEQRVKAERAALDLDQLAVQYNILRRTVETHKASYSQLLARLNDATISAQLRGPSMKISEMAVPPSAPISPDTRKTLVMTVVLGVSILLVYPFGAEMLFGRIRSAADVEYHLDSELIGEIGSVHRVSEKDRSTLVRGERDETVTEQFRALYSQLALTSKIDPPKTILITSTVPGEGKSFIAANLAECFVAHGRRTLLIDADLRRPTQHRNFGLDNKAGLLAWLESGGKIDAGLLADPKLGLVEVAPALFVLRAGGLSRKASELMELGRLAELLAALQRQFDIVILDTPPAGVFPDALAFAKVCHELVYICRFNVVSRRAVRDVITRLRQTELEFPGVVLNAMPTGFAGGYYYRSYSYQDTKKYGKAYTGKA